MHSIKTVATNSIFILSEKAIKILAYLASGVVIARSVGPGVFGTYSSLLSLNVILGAIAAIGLNSILAKEYITALNRKKVLINALAVRIAASLIFALLSIPIAIYIIGVDFYLALYSSLIILTTVVTVIDLYFESDLRNAVVAKYRIAGYATGLGLKLYVAVNYNSALMLILAHFFEVSLILVLSLLYLQRDRNSEKEGVFDLAYAKRLIVLGFPLLLSAIAGIIYMKVDQLFVVYFLGKEDAGLYASAVRLCEGLFIVSAVILPSFFPNLIKLYSTNRSKYKQLMMRLFCALSLVGLFISFVVILYSYQIITLLYGEQYSSASKVLSWYACCIPLIYVGELFSRWLVISNNTYLSIQRHMFGLVINLLLNYILIPQLGIEGAAIATLVAYCCSIILFSVFSPRARKFYEFLKSEKSNVKTNN